ncbi:MAG: hypothetical protein AMJ79_01155 [Phycisphaerae bacterium SM23_30]|nr:MAG: hypothetical protein AMJ79_01155 [Phycisphaerae bacterium SM23_30]
MIKFESFVDILEFAIAREVEAHQFYQDMAQQTEDRDMHNVLLGFAQEELRHKAKLEMELVKAGRVVADPEEITNFEYTDHLEHYNPLNKEYRELLQTAIKKEKLSFRFYLDLALAVKDRDVRETLIALAEEEARHKVVLEIEYDVITPKK